MDVVWPVIEKQLIRLRDRARVEFNKLFDDWAQRKSTEIDLAVIEAGVELKEWYAFIDRCFLWHDTMENKVRKLLGFKLLPIPAPPAKDACGYLCCAELANRVYYGFF